MTQRNHGFDLLKCICAFLVVCIHHGFPGRFGTGVRIIARVAVPIFFMITGYYYSAVLNKGGVKRQIKKMFWLCLSANLIYFVNELLNAIKSGLPMKQFFMERFGVIELLKIIFLNKSPFSYHLWYLGAILYILIFVYLFEKIGNREKLYPLVPFLLLINLVLGSYSKVIFGREVPLSLSRNSLFVGLPFFLIGDYLSSTNLKVRMKHLIALMGLFAITSFAEFEVMNKIHMYTTEDLFVSTIFLAICMFVFARQKPGRMENWTLQLLCFVGEKLSTSIYILFPLMITITDEMFRTIGKRYLWVNTLYNYATPMIVFICLIAASYILYVLKGIVAKKSPHFCGRSTQH